MQTLQEDLSSWHSMIIATGQATLAVAKKEIKNFHMTLTHELGWLQPHFQGLVLKGEERPWERSWVAESCSHVGVSEEGFSCEYLQELNEIC